jgi:hypothetical protein
MANALTAGAEPGDSKEPASARGQYVDRLTGELRLEIAEQPAPADKGPVIARCEKSILQWSWERNGFTDGQTYVWAAGGRPYAFGGAFLIPNEKIAHYELVSISPEPLIAKLKDKTVWTPPAVSLTWWKVPDAPPPAASERVRLSQLRKLSQQISGVARMGPPRYEEGTRWELRLLTTPLYRYTDAEQGVLGERSSCWSWAPIRSWSCCWRPSKMTAKRIGKWPSRPSRASSWPQRLASKRSGTPPKPTTVTPRTRSGICRRPSTPRSCLPPKPSSVA